MNLEEHEFEPVPGLPETLPEGERILWQGSPRPWSLARHAFHLPLVVAWFLLMALIDGIAVVDAGGSFAAALVAASRPLVPGAAGVALLLLLARVNAHAALVTLTNRRIVLRFGVALPLTMNVPFESIQSAALKLRSGDTGDVIIETGGERLRYLVMWPFVRPWRFMQPELMLRGLPRAQTFAQLLGDALAVHAGQGLHVVAADPAGTDVPMAAGAS